VYTFTKLHDRRLTNVGVGPVEFQLYATPTFLSLDLPPSSGLAYLSLHYPVYGLQAGAGVHGQLRHIHSGRYRIANQNRLVHNLRQPTPLARPPH